MTRGLQVFASRKPACGVLLSPGGFRRKTERPDGRTVEYLRRRPPTLGTRLPRPARGNGLSARERPTEYGRRVRTEQLREAYDRQLRVDGELLGASLRRDEPPLSWAVFDHGGFVTYERLDVEGESLDALIAETVAYFRDQTDVASFEWKTRGHDRPADLGERLVAHGLVAEPVETVMVGRADALLAAPPAPGEVLVRRAGEHPGRPVDLLMDVAAVLAFQVAVFGQDRGARLDSVVASVRAGEQEYWIAEVGGLIVGAGTLRPVPGTSFAGIWGGGVHPSWRGRGIYRALVAARAASALERGIELIHSDCTDMSRPILERSGLVPVTTTTPYVWTRPAR